MQALKHDGIIKVATGSSRFEKKWKNKSSAWSAIVDKITKTTRTRETLTDYKKMKKADQDAIKDVGGFVGGVVSGGRRNIGSVNERYLLTLDADHAPKDFDPLFEADMTLGCGMAWYSTHKHTPDHPRLRLVIPITRPVDADEYQALTRKVAEAMGIDNFDDTTYQPHRLMYWPSTSEDADFSAGLHDAPWLDPDAWLAKYSNWRDVSEWPFSSRQTEAMRKHADKQGDPAEKSGMVGAFCRAYTVEEVIEEFLADQYTPAGGDRYTYAGGSTSGGVIVYQEGAFLYSHHATDPISGQLVNAFDLLRLHKYKELDIEAGIDESVSITKRPSYQAMAEFAKTDKRVKRQIGASISNATDDFEDLGSENWAELLDVNSRGGLLPTAKNVILILRHDSRLKKKFLHDEFSHRAVVVDDLPWRPKSRGMYWNDTDDAGLRNYLSSEYNIKGQGIIADAWKEVLQHNATHPVKDYLNRAQWDGVPRLETILIDYLGAEDSLYTRAITRKSMVAGVARIMRPGIKFDNVLVMVGAQGLGKSYILKRLGGDWHSDSLTTVTGKEAYEQLQGAWIIEMAELSATRKAEAEAIKHFISKQEDMFRVSYDRHVSIFPRQCVFFGTTNDDNFLRDRTGNRRFWPLRVGHRGPSKDLFTDLTDAEVAQIWAEAVHHYHEGMSLWLDDQEERLADEIRGVHTEEEPMVGVIQKFLETPIPDDWEDFDTFQRQHYMQDEKHEGTRYRTHTCVMEIWLEGLGGRQSNLSSNVRREIQSALKSVPGWGPYEHHKKTMRFKNYGPQKAYTRID
jgi:putative DNA primase/helicase